MANPVQSGAVRSLAVPKGKGGGFRGYDPQALQFDLYDPQTQQAIAQARNTAVGMIGQPQFNVNQNSQPFNFAPIAQQARTQFAQQTVPSILERLTGLGAQRSSALGQQLGAAGAGLEESLASLGAQYGLQNRAQEAQIGLQNQGQLIQYILSLLGLGTRPTYENAYIPRQSGFAENAAMALFGAAPKAAAMYYGGGTNPTKPTP